MLKKQLIQAMHSYKHQNRVNVYVPVHGYKHTHVRNYVSAMYECKYVVQCMYERITIII